MPRQRNRPFGRHYVFVVVGLVFLALVVGAGTRATPGVLILPLEQSLHWRRDLISLAAAIGLLLYGLLGPLAATLMQDVGIRRTLSGALLVMAGATGISAYMTRPWQMMLTWGLLSGAATSCVAGVLAATVVNRWFHTHRGLMMGLLTASGATGTLVFLPLLAWLAQSHGWQLVVLCVSAAAAALVPLVLWLLPESPADAGLLPFGATAAESSDPQPDGRGGNPLRRSFAALGTAARSGTFWCLFTTFFVCGYTTNGLIGTHLIAFCGDHGIGEVRAAGLLAAMGLFDLVGTTASGWLTDRFDSRKLLFAYYGLRGLALAYIPYSDFSTRSLWLFALFFGLDWIATIPPTLRLATAAFGERQGPVIFGWLVAGHQLGAAISAYLAGVLRVLLGSYVEAFVLAGVACLFAASLALLMRPVPRQPAPTSPW